MKANAIRRKMAALLPLFLAGCTNSTMAGNNTATLFVVAGAIVLGVVVIYLLDVND